MQFQCFVLFSRWVVVEERRANNKQGTLLLNKLPLASSPSKSINSSGSGGGGTTIKTRLLSTWIELITLTHNYLLWGLKEQRGTYTRNTSPSVTYHRHGWLAWVRGEWANHLRLKGISLKSLQTFVTEMLSWLAGCGPSLGQDAVCLVDRQSQGWGKSNGKYRAI